MKAWLSTMPVDGESSAATHESSGSSVFASSADIGSRSLTPFLSACA